MEQVLDDWENAPIDEKLRAVLTFLRKLTLSPADVGAHDIGLLRDAGISDAAIVDAATVCSLLNIIDRISDAIGFKLMPADHLTRSARVLNRFGYRLNILTAYPGRRSLRRERRARQHRASVAALRRSG